MDAVKRLMRVQTRLLKRKSGGLRDLRTDSVVIHLPNIARYVEDEPRVVESKKIYSQHVKCAAIISKSCSF